MARTALPALRFGGWTLDLEASNLVSPAQVVVAVISVIAVRWVTRPRAQPAVAAEALGRDMQHPPLDENGPQEVRRAAM